MALEPHIGGMAPTGAGVSEVPCHGIVFTSVGKATKLIQRPSPTLCLLDSEYFCSLFRKTQLTFTLTPSSCSSTSPADSAKGKNLGAY